MVGILINPGTQSVDNTTESHAIMNIRHFVMDCGNDLGNLSIERIPEKDYGGGRFAFRLCMEKSCCEIQMPGIPLEDVRFVNSKDQNAWDYPRLYVDNNSWLWEFAVEIVKEAFSM